jgi:hypothetical protein
MFSYRSYLAKTEEEFGEEQVMVGAYSSKTNTAFVTMTPNALITML